MKQLRGRNAILTGASRGIGVHIARAFAREGINLALAARSAGALEKVREDAAARGVNAVAIPTDLADATQVAALATEAESELGPVDILVNNAGVEFTAPYEEHPREEIEAAVRVNLLAAMLLTQAVLPAMLSRGRGHIVNMSSVAGKIGLPYQIPYAATKAGLVMFTHSLRSELMNEPVGVSVVCPGFVADDGMYGRIEERGWRAPKPLRPTTTDRVAGAVVRAIRKDAPELIVNPLPVRPLVLLREGFSRITPHLHRVLGITGFVRKIAGRRSEGENSARATPEARQRGD